MTNGRRRRRSQRGNFSVFLTIIIIGALLIGGFFLFGTIQQTILSVSDVQVLGEGERVLITTAVGQGVENIAVELTRDELNQQLSGTGWNVDRGVLIELNLLDFEHVYPLVQFPSQTFRTLSVVDAGTIAKPLSLVDNSFYRDQCVQRGFTDAVFGTLQDNGLFVSDKLLCVVPSIFGVNGDVSGSGTSRFTVNVMAGGDSDQITEEITTARLLGGDIEVSFEGLLDAPTQIQQVPFNVFFKDGSFQFLISETSASFTPEGADTNSLTACYGNFVPSGLSGSAQATRLQGCVNNWNQDMLDSIQDVSDQFAPEIVQSITFSGNQMIVDVQENSVPQYPVIRILVDGQFLGIDRLEGIPSITSCPADISEKNGVSVTTNLEVENIGSEIASFDVSASCDNPLIDVLTNDILAISPDTRESTSIKVFGSSETPNTIESAVCEILVEDRVSGRLDTCEFNVEYEFADVICQSNTRSCSADRTQVLECSSDGTELVPITTCSEDLECGVNEDTSAVECVDKGISFTPPFFNGGDDGLFGNFSIGDFQLEDLGFGLGAGFAVIVIIIIIIAVILLFTRFRGGRGGTRVIVQR